MDKYSFFILLEKLHKLNGLLKYNITTILNYLNTGYQHGPDNYELYFSRYIYLGYAALGTGSLI